MSEIEIIVGALFGMFFLAMFMLLKRIYDVERRKRENRLIKRFVDEMELARSKRRK